MKTYLSTDWIEVHDHGSVYMARVFLTDDNHAYMILVRENENKFFRVRSELLRFGEIGFFEKVMEDAEELPLKYAFAMGLLRKGQ